MLTPEQLAAMKAAVNAKQATNSWSYAGQLVSMLSEAVAEIERLNAVVGKHEAERAERNRRRSMTKHERAALEGTNRADAKEATPALGSVSGKLEVVSVHNSNKFTLYPPIPGEVVDCSFADKDLEDVLRAVGHKVTVYGTLYYAPSKIFPVAVDVESFEVQSDDSLLPTLLDAKEAT